MAVTSAWWVVTNGLIASYAGRQQERQLMSVTTMLESFSDVSTDTFRAVLRKNGLSLVPLPDHLMSLRYFKCVTFGFILPAGLLNVIILIGEYQAQVNHLRPDIHQYGVLLAVFSVLLSVLTGIVILVFSMSFDAWVALKELAQWNTIHKLLASSDDAGDARPDGGK
jgi:hypothetical protein